jgi:hypothetical protein
MAINESVEKIETRNASLAYAPPCLNAITQDQPRLRSNLKELPQSSEAFKRIVAKFNEQETQIERYQADIKKLQGVEHGQRKAFDDFLAAFTAE